MNEYIRVYDSTDDLSEVNTYATEGWRVIASFNDDRRGQMFIMEREVMTPQQLEDLRNFNRAVHRAAPALVP